MHIFRGIGDPKKDERIVMWLIVGERKYGWETPEHGQGPCFDTPLEALMNYLTVSQELDAL